MASYLRPRRGKKATAVSQNVVLRRGEIFFEVPDTGVGTGNGKIKMGDGTTAYSALPYFMEPTQIDVAASTIEFTEATETDNAVLLSAIASGAQLKTLIGNIKKLLSNLNTSVTQLNNDLGNLENLNTVAKDNIVNAVNDCFQYASNGKKSIVDALTGKGIDASTDLSFQELATLITEQYSTSQTITYNVDTNTVYTEKRLKGADATKPETFTPSKSGYTFVGWRTDSQANSTVQSSMIIGMNDITLYAVFKKAVTCTFISYNSSKTATGYIYYNNGNSVNASVTVPTGASMSGWTWRGWSAAGTTTGNATVSYANGATISGLTSNKTYYGLYSITITLSYNGNSNTGGSTSAQTGTRYYNAYGNYVNPSFTLKSNGFTRTNYAFSKWAQGSASGTQYAAGASVTLSANTTFYAVWIKQDLNLTLTGGSWLQSNILDSTYLVTGSTVTDKILTYDPDHDGYRAAAYQTVLFDVSNFSKLVMTGTDVVTYNYDDPIYHSTVIELLNSSGTVVKTLYNVIDQKISKTTSANISINSDISSLKGNHRIRIHVGTWGDGYYPKKITLSTFKLQ